jgi:hypothetical protein
MRSGLLNYCRAEEPPLDTAHRHRPHLRRPACCALRPEEGHEPGCCRGLRFSMGYDFLEESESESVPPCGATELLGSAA